MVGKVVTIPYPKPEHKVPQPMIMQLSPSQLLLAINRFLESENIETIPESATVSVRVPGGGDYSNTDLELDEGEIGLDIRWER